MFEEKNLNETTPEQNDADLRETEGTETVAEAQAEPAVEAEEVVEATEEVVEEKVEDKPAKGLSKAEAHRAGREKAKAKRAERRANRPEKTEVKKEKLHLTPEEKAQKREEKALAKEMQTAKAVAKYVRMSPLKVNVVLDLIRGKDVKEAMAILQYTQKDAAAVISKVLKSAAANAENNFDMDMDALYVAECHVGAGPTIKRFQPHAQGRAFPILKRSSHVTVVVAERA